MKPAHPYYRLATVAVVAFLGFFGFWGDPLAAGGIALIATAFVGLGEALRWIGL